MHQHPISHPGLGQTGEAHLLAHTTEIHLGTAPKALIYWETVRESGRWISR